MSGMFGQLTDIERGTLDAKLRSAERQFLAEYDALRDASPATLASYGRTALATDWLMCCVETGRALRVLRGQIGA